jgi:hypothetical protein
MDQLNALINAYKTKKSINIRGVETDSELSLIREIALHFHNNYVLDFLFATMLDEREYDLARIEIINMFLCEQFSEQDRSRIGQALIQIVSDDIDDDVRTYAALAMERYIDVDTVRAIQVLSEICLNSEDYLDVRLNAILAIKQAEPTTETIEVMRALLNDQYVDVRESAERLLAEWNISKD